MPTDLGPLVRLFSDNARSTIVDDPLLDTDTSLEVQSGDGAKFPDPAGDTSSPPLPTEYFIARLVSPSDVDDPDAVSEKVIITARVGDVMTIERAYDGTAAQQWPVGTVLEITWDRTAAQSAFRFPGATQVFRGLEVRTHRNTTEALSKVEFRADTITFDNNEEILDIPWTEVDLTASGAGGLDTGAEASSTPYRLLAILDPITKDVQGLLTKQTDYFLDESYNSGEDGEHGLRTGATTNILLGQSFKVDTAGPLRFVDVKIIKNGSPVGQYWFTQEANSSSVPSGTPFATSDKYDAARVPTSASFIRIPFRDTEDQTVPDLVVATTYWLVMYGDYTVSGANYISWRADTTAGAYANGAKASYDGTTWTVDTDDDFIFKIYIERQYDEVLPTGYTAQCLIQPFIYNNGSGNIKPFRSKDREIIVNGSDWKIGSFSSNLAVLTHLDGFVPPVKCNIIFGLSGAVANELCSLGELFATDSNAVDVTTNLSGSYQIALTAYSRTNTPTNPSLLIPVEFQGILGGTNANATHAWVAAIRW